jgi:hypothetical protein
MMMNNISGNQVLVIHLQLNEIQLVNHLVVVQKLLCILKKIKPNILKKNVLKKLFKKTFAIYWLSNKITCTQRT